MFTLAQVVPWGRSFDEYRRMFALSDDALRLRVVGCGDGPASFNAEATRRGAKVVSCDPIYRYDVDQLRDRIDSTYDDVLEQTRRNADEFVWNAIRSVEELGRLRMAAMTDFLGDYVAGKAQGRTTQLGEAFHHAAIREMCRVAAEVRIFPLLALGATPSPIVARVVEEFSGRGFSVSIEDVAYEFQRGGNQMMRIHSPQL